MPKFLLCIIIFCLTSLTWGQKSSQQAMLEKRKEQIKKEIINNEKMLKSVKNKEKSALNVYSIQKNKIKLQEKLIKTNENQTNLLINDIRENQIKIDKLGKDLKDLKSDYAKKIVQAHRSKTKRSKLLFLLSSSSFSQAYKRIQYLKQYTNFRKSQGLEIKNKSLALIEANNLLNDQKEVKVKLVEQNKTQRLALIKDKAEQEKLVLLLKKDKKRLLSEIIKKQSESKKIDKLIGNLIREAIAESNRRTARERARQLANAKAVLVAKERARQKASADSADAANRNRDIASNSSSAPSVVVKKPVYVPTKPREVEPEAPKTEVSSTVIDLTPELKAAGMRFSSNKGKLIWPVENGFISDKFGKSRHDVFSTLETFSNGIEITTGKRAQVRAVFDGVVSNILVMSPISKAVMVQHGDYMTVYQNLVTIDVSKGDIVSENQSIGILRTSSESGKAVLKFLVFKNTDPLNPMQWLMPK